MTAGADDSSRPIRSCAATRASPICLRAVMSFHEPTTSIGSPAALRKQPRILAKDPLTVLGMHAGSPEIRTLKIFLGIVPEQVLHIPADERWRVVAARLEAVDYRRRSREQIFDAVPGRRRGCFRSLALADVAPRAYYLGRLTTFVPDQSLRVVDPAVSAVLLEESVLDGVVAPLEQLDGLSFHRGEVVRVHAASPEIGVLQVLAGLVTEPVADILTDERRREISCCPVAVDHRG